MLTLVQSLKAAEDLLHAREQLHPVGEYKTTEDMGSALKWLKHMERKRQIKTS